MIEIIIGIAGAVSGYLAAHADLVLALTALSFVPSTALTVIEQLRRRASTVPLTTSLPTAAALYFLVLVFSVLALPFTAVVDGLTGTLWAIIAFQRIRYGTAQNADEAEIRWFEGYLRCRTPEERHEYLHQTNSEHNCEALTRSPRPYVKGTVVCGTCKEDHTPGQPCGTEALRDAAMWVVKNFDEWSDSPAWGGEPLDALIESIGQLRGALGEEKEES